MRKCKKTPSFLTKPQKIRKSMMKTVFKIFGNFFFQISVNKFFPTFFLKFLKSAQRFPSLDRAFFLFHILAKSALKKGNYHFWDFL